MAQLDRLVTVEEYARIPDDDHRYELVDGRVIRMSPPGTVHAVLATRIATLLSLHTDAHGLGVVMTPGGFHLASNPDTVREPDVAFVCRDRIPETGLPEGFWPGPPDLAVEIKSPGDRPAEIAAKLDQYLSRGVRVIWLVDPRKRIVTVYAPSASPVTLTVDNRLDGGEVLPGFSCAIRKLFD